VSSRNQLHERRVASARRFHATSNDQFHLDSAPTHLHGDHTGQGDVPGATTVEFRRRFGRELDAEPNAIVTQFNPIDRKRQCLGRRRLRSKAFANGHCDLKDRFDLSPAPVWALDLADDSCPIVQDGSHNRSDAAFELGRWDPPASLDLFGSAGPLPNRDFPLRFSFLPALPGRSARTVPGRRGMSYTDENWVDDEATSHRGPEE
jgi:hypothetical protein